MDLEQQQCFLAGLGYYTLRRRDGTLAVDGIPGPATTGAIRSFQQDRDLLTDGIFGPATEAALRRAIAEGEEREKPHTDGPDWWGNYPAVRREDWRCRCGGRFCSGFPAEPHEETVAMLQKFADHFGGEILWNSGLRCRRYNATIPGASPNSRHCLGMAYDFHMAGVTPDQLAAYGETLMPDRGGIGIYSWGIHLDDRPVKARWRG